MSRAMVVSIAARVMFGARRNRAPDGRTIDICVVHQAGVGFPPSEFIHPVVSCSLGDAIEFIWSTPSLREEHHFFFPYRGVE